MRRRKKVLVGLVVFAACWLLGQVVLRRVAPYLVGRAHEAHMQRLVQQVHSERDNALRETAEALQGTFLHVSRPVGTGAPAILCANWQPGLSVQPLPPERTVEIAPEQNAGDVGARINALLRATSGPLRVRLNEGDYDLAEPIRMRSGVVLAGAGMRRTRVWAAGRNAVQFCGEVDDKPVELRGDLLPGARTIHVPDAELSRLEPGQLVCIVSTPPSDPRAPQGAAAPCRRQVVGVAGVRPADSAIELDTPLRLRFADADRPHLFIIRPVRFAGLEGMTVSTRPGVPRQECEVTVLLDGAADCWVRDCELRFSYFSHIWVRRSKGLLFAGNYLHEGWGYGHDDAADPPPHGLFGYGLCLSDAASDCLATDNAFAGLRHAMIVQRGASGNVLSYNFSTGTNPQKNKDEAADFSAHGDYPYMNLAEGNVLDFIHSSDWRGAAGPLQTFFRNRVQGRGILISTNSHFPVVAGNVLERGGIYLCRWVAGATVIANRVKGRSLPGEIPDAPLTYFLQDGGPAVQGLIASLYLSARPDFLGDTPWPCFGPDVSDDVKLPAERRYDQLYRKWPEPVAPRQ